MSYRMESSVDASHVDYVVELRKEGAGWSKIAKLLRKRAPTLKHNDVGPVLDAAKARLESDKKIDGHRVVSENRRESDEVFSRTEGVHGVEEKGVHPVQDRPEETRSYLPADLDEGLLGLSLISKELRRRWGKRDLGNLSIWRPLGRDAPRSSDRWVMREWVMGGGQGEYLLRPDAVRALLKMRGLNPERVLVDLQDMGITRCDAGHATKLVRVPGEDGARRVVVLPDGYVRRRSSLKLGSFVGRQKGLELLRRGYYEGKDSAT